ncbi:hypothetical protein [Sulfurospirillum barnesii]|uniref:Uncharacterized protein n=1 Tax=Sulfurospirillum barnesii (strain ATCC 700032 / DSM 10660 / SES-3) TaxID=760154 RepID=I3XVT9_SULBS|nr:hypothetical protein [Sulfurospirillum barnesii]AFL68063.1 hypothetical protein Sulba_0759 [Sulfurospirillum barnesii SES-3]
MIKTFLATLFLGGIGLCMILFSDVEESRIFVVPNNTKKEPLEIVLERYYCSQDKVPILELFNTAQAIKPNGDTYFFNDIGSFFLWVEKQNDKKALTLWVYATDTERYVSAQSAWYSRVEITPMGYGFSPYEFHIYDTSDYYFDEVYTFAIRGETLWNPMVRHLLVENKL